MSISILRVAAGVVAGSLCCCVALAQSTPSPSTSAASAGGAASATIAQSVDAAWRHREAGLASQDRRRQAGAAGVAARSWLPDAPALELSTRSDRFNADAGATEHEIGVALPLWMPGQRAARIAAADAQLAWAEASAEADRLKLAGEVRERAWEFVAAQSQLRLAEEQASASQALADDVARRVRAGELARTDLLDAQAESLAAQSQSLDARSRLAAAQAQWRALTGLGTAPDPTEAARGAGAADGSHPALRLAELGVERASRAIESTRRSSREAPELGVGMRQERGDRAQPIERTVAVSLRWTFGTDARNEPLLAAAHGEFDTARAEALALRQQLEGEHLQARAALDAATTQFAAAERRAELLRQRAALIEAAFKAGETELPVLLRARSAVAQSAAALAQQQAAQGLARARLHQALGLLP